MDSNILILIVIALFVLLAIVGFIRYKGQGKVKIKGPAGIEMEFGGDNETPPTPPGITVKGAKSRKGQILAEDYLGRGIDAENLDAMQDVVLKTENNPTHNPATSSSSSSDPRSSLNTQALNAGGNITIQQFVGGEVSNEQQREFFANQIGATIPRNDRFCDSQFNSYCNAWKNLQALRLAGDDLWERASEENISSFKKTLRETKALLLNDDIFFEDRDRVKLASVLQKFESFRFEKERLSEMRATRYSENYIQRQIERNSHIKGEYEDLLDDLRISFRNKVSAK
jgi:hypothetical protein